MATRRNGCAGGVAAWSSGAARTIGTAPFHMVLHYRRVSTVSGEPVERRCYEEGVWRDRDASIRADRHSSIDTGARRLAPRAAENRGGVHAPRACGNRPRHHLHGQRLGLPRGGQRNALGQGARGAPRQGLSDDEVLHAWAGCAHGHEAARRVASAAEDRLPRSLADPRSDLRRRTGTVLCARRRRRSARPGATAGKGALRRLHGAQEPGSASGDAGARLPVGFLPAAAQLLRCDVSQLRGARPAGAESPRHRRASA